MLKLNISHLLKAGFEKLSMFWVIQLNLYCKSVLDYICVTRPDIGLADTGADSSCTLFLFQTDKGSCTPAAQKREAKI